MRTGRPRKYSDEFRQSLWDMHKTMTWVEIGRQINMNPHDVERTAKKLWGDEDSKIYRPRIIRETRKWNFHGQDVATIY